MMILGHGGLSKQGLTTILTTWDPTIGLIALRTFQIEVPKSIHYHQLDLIYTNLVKKLATWLQKEFEGFDILVRKDDEKPTSFNSSLV